MPEAEPTREPVSSCPDWQTAEESGAPAFEQAAPRVVAIVQLGRMEYSEALRVQKDAVELRKTGKIGDTLLLVEHPAVLTLGRNAHRENIVANRELLSRRGVSIFEVDRGGDVTYHGPGQLVGYPIVDLRGFSPRMGVIDYVRKLEEVLIRACADFGISAERVPGRTGVWTMPGGEVSEKKIAAIGVHISRAVTSHGFALNVTTDLREFGWIVPCGISDRGVTSVELEMDPKRGRTPTLENASNAVARHFGRVFGEQVVWADSFQSLVG